VLRYSNVGVFVGVEPSGIVAKQAANVFSASGFALNHIRQTIVCSWSGRTLLLYRHSLLVGARGFACLLDDIARLSINISSRDWN